MEQSFPEYTLRWSISNLLSQNGLAWCCIFNLDIKERHDSLLDFKAIMIVKVQQYLR